MIQEKKKYYITKRKNFDITYDGLFIIFKNLEKRKEKKHLIKLFNCNNFKFFFKKKIFFFNNYRVKNKLLHEVKKLLIEFERGYCCILNLIGLGFNVTVWKNKYLRFNIGYNHLIYYIIPNNILIKTKTRRKIFLFSFFFLDLKNVIIDIKNFRKLSIYKLKGIQEKDELYKKKNWKKAIF